MYEKMWNKQKNSINIHIYSKLLKTRTVCYFNMNRHDSKRCTSEYYSNRY